MSIIDDDNLWFLDGCIVWINVACISIDKWLLWVCYFFEVCVMRLQRDWYFHNAHKEQEVLVLSKVSNMQALLAGDKFKTSHSS